MTPAQPQPPLRPAPPNARLPAWWQWIRCVVWALTPAWPAVLVAVAYALLMLYPDQVKDLALGADVDWSLADLRPALLAFWNIVLGLALWFEARLLIAQYRVPPAGLPDQYFDLARIGAITHAPAIWFARVLGIVPCALAALAFGMARSHWVPDPDVVGDVLHLAPLIYQLAGAAIVLAFVLVRRPATTRLAAARPALAPMLKLHARVVAEFHGLSELTWLALLFGCGWIVVAFGFTVWSFWPVSMGHTLGPFAVLSIGLIGIAVGLGALAFVQRNWHVPVFIGVGLLAVIASVTADNHKLPASHDSRPAPDITLAAAYRTFLGRSPDGRVLLVATAGGGIRAAYWTAYALGKLHDAVGPALDRRLFSISGVSGGGVGAVFYRAMLKAAAANGGNVCALRLADGTAASPTPFFAACADTILSQDGIGPSLTAMMFTDLLQRFVPVGWLPDRAGALGAAWENAWNVPALPSSHGYMGQSFAQLWPDPADPFPILLLNGTSVASGNRIITTNLDLRRGAAEPEVFHDVRPFPLPYPISAATAALNTARFPFISPPGTIPATTPPDVPGTFPANPDASADQIIDGGVFENSGAQTTNELLDWLIGQSRLAGPGARDIFVLQITSDPEEADDGQEGCVDPHDPVSQAKPATVLPDLTSAAIGFFRSRGARGVAAMAALRSQAAGKDPTLPRLTFAELRLKAFDDRANAPLGWTLSGKAIQAIQASWPERSTKPSVTAACNRTAIDALTTWLIRP